MFKCTGKCELCGRCQRYQITDEDNTENRDFIYPEDFLPDMKKNTMRYGVAFDVGTTTVVGTLWDFRRCRVISSRGMANPQKRYGSDVISRISYCAGGDENLETMRKLIVDCMNSIIHNLCEEQGIDGSAIGKVVICGNTTMSHIISGYSPQSLASAPFEPQYTGTIEKKPVEMGLNVNDEGEIILLPNIASHVGGDIIAGLVSTRFLNAEGLSIFIDIGTNGEMVITEGAGVYACSTAAGPAFEGAAICCGMRAAKGAISAAAISDGEVFFQTVGQCEPRGICGSGLIDIVYEMVKNELIDETGRLISSEKAEAKGLHAGLRARLTGTGRERCFIVVSKENGDDIIITQNDIREVQLAKAAIRAGIEVMLAKGGKREKKGRRRGGKKSAP